MPRQPTSMEYKVFKEEDILAKRPTSLYERLCNVAEKIIKIEPDQKTKEKIERAIKITHLNVSPEGVGSLTVLSCLIICFLGFLGILLSFYHNIPVFYGIFIFLLSLPVGYYLYNYPMRYEKRFLTAIGSEITFLILYMIVYLRESPNLEGALRFASKNLSGPLALDIRKLMWDIEVGKYKTVDEALIDYTSLWTEDRYFIEAIQMLRSSLKYTEEKRIATLEEAISIVLEGAEEKTKHYSQELKTPILLLHALGILLPVMGLVMFPIVGIFMKIKVEVLFLGYDVILPLVLYFFITDIMQRRPPTSSPIAEHPHMASKNRFIINIKGKPHSIPSILIALIISIPVIVFGVYTYLSNTGDKLIESIIITTGIMIGFVMYYFLSSFQKVKLREELRKIELEFTEALFQLGNQVSTGVPIEVAIERSTKAIGEMNIKKFFAVILRNMQRLGMTFSQAIFDREYGAASLYPSVLIKSIMKIVVDSAKKGVQTASVTMLNISKYLRNVHQTQERIHDMLEDVLSSLRFQGFLLTPLVSGIIVTMATIMIGILQQITASVSGIDVQTYMAGIPFLLSKIGITPGAFQLICSIYFIEASILTGMFINRIENGEDEIGKQNLTLRILVIGGFIYAISLFGSLFIFGPLTKVPV
ncbi:MAG: hypothetical protein QXQ40_01045 [Candidatus Aenigmatarchaeota archaeon]